MTDEQLAAIREWLEQASEPCGNDACIGEWAAVHGRALLDEVERLTAENEAMRDILKPFMPLIVPPGCNVWALVKAVVSGLRKPIPMPEEDPIRKDVWVGGRSDVVARLGDD